MEPQETVDYHIKSLWLSISNMYNQIAQQFEMTQATGYVLLNLHQNEGTPATKIAPMMGMRATSLSRMLRKMEDLQLIYRSKDSEDGRSVMIYLTEKGKGQKEIAKKVVKDFNSFILNKLTKSQAKNYFEIMHTIKDFTEEYKEQNLMLK